MDLSSLSLVEPATREKLSLRRAGVLGSIFFGASVTEAVSVNLLPLTLALYTRDPNLIFWVLAINPAFGFIAQPLVGLLSDHVWTRIGRRAVFLVLAGPIVACSLVMIPYAGSFALLVAVVIVLQFFQDVINGSDQPLLADLVPPEQRTFALGLVKSAENTGFMLVLFFGMPM
ncbi:MFS transporter, partial [Pirellulales bacterium]|nr:MFS transporter [Pirellulales bacterium]